MLKETFERMIDKLASLNEDEEIHISDPDDIPENEEESSDPKNPRESLRLSIEAQADIAQSVIDSIYEAFSDKCNGLQIMGNMEDQIKNWEKTMKGACYQVIQMVETKNFIIDKTQCNPHAYNMIKDCASRDSDTLKTAAAVIVFYNSLK